MIQPLESRLPIEQPALVTPNLYAVASGKGGVGKTWFSCSLAHSLARNGMRALLFDGDLGLANVDVQLGLMPQRDLGTFIAGRANLTEVKMTYPAGGFDIIAGRSGTGTLSNVAPSKLLALRQELIGLAKSYDHVIMDMGAGIERTIRSFTNQARATFVVTTDEPTAITDAYAFIKLTTMERPKADIRIVVNMANTPQEGERTYNILLRACREFLKIEPVLAGIVRRDNAVRESIRKQSSLLTRYPNSEAAQDVARIADGLMRTP